jgi:hypothetical protein
MRATIADKQNQRCLYLISRSHWSNLTITRTSGRFEPRSKRGSRHRCSSQEFVSWTGETKPYWFEKLELPKDAWETPKDLRDPKTPKKDRGPIASDLSQAKRPKR